MAEKTAVPASQGIRPLTDAERVLARWMLEHGGPNAAPFLSQLARAMATTERCPCGCASYDFRITGLAPAPPGVHSLADFCFGSDDDLQGVFIFESGGILSGVEVVGYGGPASAKLPHVADLRRANS